MQRKRKLPSKKRASLRVYTPEKQLAIGFDNPFSKEFDQQNRWVILSNKIPWDELVSLYYFHHPPKATGRPGVNPRILIGSVIIKHLNDYDDRETIEQIRENVYLQYFLGFSSFTQEAPFDASVFVSIRKKLTPPLLQLISERLMEITQEKLLPKSSDLIEDKQDPGDQPPPANDQPCQQQGKSAADLKAKDNGVDTPPTHKGELLMDASVAPQAIAYPTDLNLLNDARMMSEKLIDQLYELLRKRRKNLLIELEILQDVNTVFGHGLDPEEEIKGLLKEIKDLKAVKKPRTYRKKARKYYLQVAQNKKPGKKIVRRAIGRQLRYLRRNFKHINHLLDRHFPAGPFPLEHSLQRYYWIIQLLYEQQLEMFNEKKHQVDNRLVSIHQPYVRPIVRGKTKAKVEFGAKIHLSLINGYSFLDTISWDAFNESTHLQQYVENYKSRLGYYPEKVLVDKIYCTRENRKWLKERHIKLSAKPLGRPSAQAVANHVRPGERNPIEGKFGQAKQAYGMNRIRAKLQLTSESWIASIILVLNLVNMTRVALLCAYFSGFLKWCNAVLRPFRASENKMYAISYVNVRVWQDLVGF